MATPVTGVHFHSSVLHSSALKCPGQSFFKDKRAVNSSISPLPADYLARHKILMLPCISRSALPLSRAPQSNQDIIPIHRFPSIMEGRLVTTSPQSATSPRELQTDKTLCVFDERRPKCPRVKMEWRNKSVHVRVHAVCLE